MGGLLIRLEETAADQGALHFDHPESDSYRSTLFYQMNPKFTLSENGKKKGRK